MGHRENNKAKVFFALGLIYVIHLASEGAALLLPYGPTTRDYN